MPAVPVMAPADDKVKPEPVKEPEVIENVTVPVPPVLDRVVE